LYARSWSLFEKGLEPLKQCEKLENSGDFFPRASSYLSALISDDGRAARAQQDEGHCHQRRKPGKKELDDYISWLLIQKNARSNDFQSVIAAIDRCAKQSTAKQHI